MESMIREIAEKHYIDSPWDVDVASAEDMLCSGKYTYTEIGRIMRGTYGIQVSKSSIARYASHLYMEQIAP